MYSVVLMAALTAGGGDARLLLPPLQWLPGCHGCCARATAAMVAPVLAVTVLLLRVIWLLRVLLRLRRLLRLPRRVGYGYGYGTLPAARVQHLRSHDDRLLLMPGYGYSPVPTIAPSTCRSFRAVRRPIYRRATARRRRSRTRSPTPRRRPSRTRPALSSSAGRRRSTSTIS
jgi:hypothetical protein